MLYRRNASDAAIGWISTVDSLLLGFGLMVVLSLHAAMKQREAQADADHLRPELELHKKLLEDATHELAERDSELKALVDSRDDMSTHLERLEELLDAASKGTDGLNKKLREAILERDSLRARLTAVDKQLVAAGSQLESARRQAVDAAATIKMLRQERDAQAANAFELQGKFVSMEKRKRDAEQTNESLAKEVEKLTATLASNSRDLDSLRTALKDREREISKLKADAARAAEEMSVTKRNREEEAKAEGQAAATEVLGFKGKFKNVVFVIDISHSMTHIKDPERPGFENDTYNPKRWEKTRREIVSWARHLPMETLRLVFFHSKVFEYPGDGKFYSMRGANRVEAVRTLEKLLERVKPTLQTNTLGALEAAYGYPDVDTMILFTDGSPLTEDKKTPELIALVRGLVRQHRDIPINVVGIGEYFESSFADFLRDIASTTGAEFIGR